MMSQLSLLLLLSSLLCLTASQTPAPTTSSPGPCWSEAFPNMTARLGAGDGNPVTCDICTDVFQGLDDFLLENEDQVIFIGTSGNCFCISLSDCPCTGKSL